MVGLAAVCWAIWKAMNNNCFENKKIISPTEIMCTISSLLFYWAELQQEEDKKSLEKGADVLEHGAALPLPARFSSRHWDGVAPVRMTLLKTTKTPPRWMTTPASSLGPSCSPDVTLLLFCFYDAVFRLS